MSDIVQKSTEYRIKQIEIAEAKYYKTLVATLDRIEREVVSLANRDLPTQDGKLIELQSAIAIRPKIKQIIDAEIVKLQQYLTEGKQTLEAQENSNVENPIPQSQTFLGDSYGK